MRKTFDRTAGNLEHRRPKKKSRQKVYIEDQAEFEAKVPKLTVRQLKFIKAYRAREPGESTNRNLVRAMREAGYSLELPDRTCYALLKYNYAGAILRALDDPKLPLDTRLLDKRLEELEEGAVIQKKTRHVSRRGERRANGRTK